MPQRLTRCQIVRCLRIAHPVLAMSKRNSHQTSLGSKSVQTQAPFQANQTRRQPPSFRQGTCRHRLGRYYPESGGSTCCQPNCCLSRDATAQQHCHHQVQRRKRTQMPECACNVIIAATVQNTARCWRPDESPHALAGINTDGDCGQIFLCRDKAVVAHDRRTSDGETK